MAGSEHGGTGIEQQPGVVAALWRYKWQIIAVAVLAGAIVFGASTLLDPVYRTEGVVILSDPRTSDSAADDLGLVLDPRRYVRNQAEIMESPPVAARAAEELGDGTTARDVQNATSAVPATDLDAITVDATMPTPEEAVAMVNAVVSAYTQIVAEQVEGSAARSIAALEESRVQSIARVAELEAQIAERPDDLVLQAQRTAAIDLLVTLETRIETLATSTALYGSGIQLYVAPEEPTAPIAPNPLRNAGVAALLAGAATGVWATRRAQEDQFAEDANAPASVLDAPLLASVPDFKMSKATGPAPTVLTPDSAAAEAYQFVLSSLEFAMESAGATSVLLTSASSGDGKTVTALNAAISAAQSGRKVLLIDADERAQGLTFLAGRTGQSGLTDIADPEGMDLAVRPWGLVDGTTVDLVSAGTRVVGNTAGFFRSRGFRAAFSVLLKQAELVIIDSPPVMSAAETTDIAASADGIVVVVRQGSSLRDLAHAQQRLSMAGTPILGYIFNRTTDRSGVSAYGYRYGYGASSGAR